MKLGIILSSPNPETNFNALRLANLAIQKGDQVKIFLVGEGVEYEKNSSAKFDVKAQIKKLVESDQFEIKACGTCLKIREQDSTDTCPLSTLNDFYDIVAWGDKVLTF